MAILTAAKLATYATMLFANRDKPDSPDTVADLSDTLAVPVTLFTATTANLSSAAHAINTTNKFAGKLVLDTTTNKLQVALGADATSQWRPVDGTTAVTPS